jgi:hypothetical protein
MKKVSILSALLVLVMMLTSLTQAEDGDLFRRNVSKTPLGETEKAAIYMMDFYVPAQSSDGLVGPVANYCLDDGQPGSADDCSQDTDYLTRDYAKPLVSVYIDGIAWEEFVEEDEFGEAQGGITFGEFDAFVGISLDDGTSWRTENLSRSADLSSFILANGHDYPGDVHAVVHQVAEDKILVVWASKYCQSGFPLYSLDPDVEADYLTDLETNYGKNALYLYDLFGVGGAQGSVNYTEQGFPEIGQIPYSCIWTARGKLLPGDDPKTADVTEASHVVWTAPERLTSGVRDANLPAVDCAGGAGCALTWQEDPEGLRPGQGLGPGEGWSGAIANAKTDIWYSYIAFADFDLVDGDGDTSTTEDEMLIEEYEALKGTEMDRPKPYVPMAMPVRLTDNDMCRATGTEDPFCWIDFDSTEFKELDHTSITDFVDGLDGPQEGADFCASTSWWDRPDPQTDIEICVTEDGRWMMGRVASTRVRMALKPYSPADAVDADSDGVLEKSAWLSLAAEETKALGITGDLDGDGEAEYDPVDIGKDMFYYSFDYAKPYNLHVNTSLDAVDDSAYVVQQGGMLNQPAKCSPWFITTDLTNPDATCPAAGEFFDVQYDPITGYEYYLTEISRRFALTLNGISNITDPTVEGNSGLAGMLIYKQGIINQGGPADIFLRRLVVPDDFDPAVDNPFAYENMECENPDGTSGWVYPTDDTYGANPNYLKGLCMAPAINLSGSTIVECTTASGNDECAADFPVADDGSIPDELKEDQFPKVLEWRQLPYEATLEGGDTFTGDLNDDTDLDDQSWENPYDIAKGHRGFLYGDMVMMMYAWSPNWQSNAVGNDHYNLYQRRSFDGGLTWTTTPSDWCGPTDGLCGVGVDALEYYYGDAIGEFEPALWHYGAGALEQARNLSLLHGNKVTILDPRYSPPGGLKQYATIRTDWLEANADLLNFTSDDVLPYADDLAIDPSKYYMVYETGDNTTVAEGEAVPLDLFYSRATIFGDVYEWFDYINDPDDCNPDPETGEIDWTACVEPRWPWLENAAEDLSGEASVVLNPGGTFAYNVWNQWKEEITDDGHELIYDSDMIFRRLLWLPDDSTVERVPIASILYQSTDRLSIADDDVLVLVGSGRDIDHVGQGADIINYMWFDDNGAIYCKIDDIDEETGEPIYECEKDTEVKASDMEPGKYHFHFKVQDNEEDWSREVTSVEVWVAEDFYDVFLPMTIR